MFCGSWQCSLNSSNWQLSGRNKGVVFTGVVFRKGCEFLLMSLREGFDVGGEGGGWVGHRQRNRQVNAQAFVKTTLS